MAETQRVEIEDVQGILVRGYARLPFCRYFFLCVDDARQAVAWLSQLAPKIAAGADREVSKRLQLAFTSTGLGQLGLARADLDTFPVEFLEGMAAPERSRVLGDLGRDAPEGWEFGGPRTPRIDLLLIVFGETPADLDALSQQEQQAWDTSGGIRVVHVEEGALSPDGREPFGFKDGISQPFIEGLGWAARRGEPPVKPGEFVLGYENQYGQHPSTPTVAAEHDPGGILPAATGDASRRDLGRNGTFLVFRKLSQDVAGFWRFMKEWTKEPDGAENPEAAVDLASRMVGRWPSGTPRVLSPYRDDEAMSGKNDFGYAEDPDGIACPIGAHIRRTNPRDSLAPGPSMSSRESMRHRLLRRGRAYGPIGKDPAAAGAAADRGLLFIAINASIRRQFEFIQQTWINNPKFAELYDETDPIVGVHPQGGAGRFTCQRHPVREMVVGMPRFVWIKGGGYFFLPGLRALRFLASLSQE
jgi:Dyp-type peroxidase family